MVIAMKFNWQKLGFKQLNLLNQLLAEEIIILWYTAKALGKIQSIQLSYSLWQSLYHLNVCCKADSDKGYLNVKNNISTEDGNCQMSWPFSLKTKWNRKGKQIIFFCAILKILMLYKIFDYGLVKKHSPVLEVCAIPRVATQSWSTEITFMSDAN